MSLDPIILAELQRGGPQLWVSGRTYPKGWEVRSPANLQRYVRKVEGAGGTDPSADTDNWEPWSKTVDTKLAEIAANVSAVKAVTDVQSGGKLRYQEFTTSGTFTPSAKLIANGGQVTAILVGASGGNGGGDGGTSLLGRTGHPGEVRILRVTVTGPTAVTIGAAGAGGTGGASSGTTNNPRPGSPGGSTSFGAAIAAGGPGGEVISNGGLQNRLKDHRLSLLEALTPGSQGQPSASINQMSWGAGTAGNPGFACVIWSE